MRLPPIALALSIATGLLVSTAARATTWYVAPGGNDTHPGSSPSAPFATIAKANAVAMPGDVVSVADGSYADFPDPARSGTSSQRIRYVGNLAAPARVVVTAFGTLDRTDVTLVGFDFSAAFSLSGVRDSVAWCQAEGPRPQVALASDCVLAHCTITADRFWFMGGETDTATKALRDTLTDNVITLHPPGPGSHTVRFRNVERSLIRRCRFVISVPAAAYDASITKFFFVKHCRIEDCSWDASSACVTGCDEAGWFVLRDVTQDIYFLRDSITLRGPGPTQFFASAAGSYPGSIMHDHYDHCVFRQVGPTSYGSAMHYQDLAQNDTLTGCVLVSSEAALSFNTGIDRVLVDHCTLAGFDPYQGVLDLNNTAAWSSLAVRSSIMWAAPSEPRTREYATIVAQLASASGHLSSDHNLVYGPMPRDSAIYCFNVGPSAPGSGKPWCTGVGEDCSSAFGNPLFLNTSSVAGFDARLGAGSAALGLGFSGTDAGAFGSGSVPPLDVIPPAAIGNLGFGAGAAPAFGVAGPGGAGPASRARSTLTRAAREQATP
ncbi:MAG TPA: DUF1565 domain-containing protein [Candidatus Eisenbacteria bacterium]|nr:DUF1565 domain-containing protein [Candidatus Eisenbacteria bacterium]